MNVKGSIIAFSVLVFSIAGSCTLDDPQPSPFNFPIQLQAEKNLSLITLSWTPVNVTGFKEYVILQSSGEIPDTPEPVINSSVTVLKRIDNAGITTLPTSDILFSQKVCYKLYVAVDERFLQSPDICVDQEINQISGFYDRAAHEVGLNEMVLYDRLEQKMSLFDHTLGAITQTVSSLEHSFPIMELHSWAGTTALFAYESTRLFRYTYPGLSLNNSRFLNGIIFAALPFGEFLFTALEEPGKSLRVYNNVNFTEIDNESGLSGNRNLAAFPGDTVILLDISGESIDRYAVSLAGQLTYLGSSTPGILQPNQQNFTGLSSDYFVGGRLGEIIDRQGKKRGQLSNGLQAFISMARISPDGKKVVYLINENNEIRIDVSDISDLQLIQKVAAFKIPFANYADLIVEEDVITVIGVSFDSGQSQTFTLKYPMP